VGNFLTISQNISFSKRTLIQGVGKKNIFKLTNENEGLQETDNDNGIRAVNSAP
jgi:hypothetical protein